MYCMLERPSKRARTSPDLKVVLDDGEFEVHSLVLHLASPVFADMLDKEARKVKNHRVDRDEVSEKSLQLPGKTTEEFKTFYNSLLISSWQPLTPSTALCLVKWANEYRIEALKAKCETVLCTQPVDIIALQDAIKYSLDRRAKECIGVMLLHIEKNIDDLKILTSSEKYLDQIWTCLCRTAGLKETIPMPPRDMWRACGSLLVQRFVRKLLWKSLEKNLSEADIE